MNNEVNSNDSTMQPVTPENNQVVSPNPVYQNQTMNQNMGMNYTPETIPPVKENIFKKIGLVPIIAISVVIILLIGGIAFKVVTSSPKAVFKSTINNLYKGINNSIDEVEKISDLLDIENKAVILKGDIKLDSNIEDIKELGFNLSDYSIGGEVGLDLNNMLMQGSVFLKGKSEKIEVNAFAEDDYLYVGSNLYEGYLKEEMEDFSSELENLKKSLEDLKKELDENVALESENYDYVIKAMKDALIKSLDSKEMKKSNEEIKIAGKKTKVTKHSYQLDDKAVQNLYKSIAENLLEDKEFLKKMAKLSGVDKEEIEDELKEMKKAAKEIEFDGKFTISLYTKGMFNTFAGLDLKFGKDELLHFYHDGENFEFKIDNNSESTYGSEVIEITSKKQDKNSKIEITYNEEKVAELTVREMSEKLIDFDFEIIDEDEKVNGTIYLSYNETKDSINGEYKVKVEYNDQYVSVEGTYGIESKDSLNKVDKDKVITEEDLDEEKILEKLKEIADKDESLKTLYEELENMAQEDIKSHLNSYGMYPLYELEDVKELFTKNKGTVLYVGSNYYSTISELDAANLFANLRTAQDKIDFYSYSYSEYYANNEFKELFKDVVPVCKVGEGNSSVPPIAYEQAHPDAPDTQTPPTQNCAEYPIIYFIKDGKVIKALQGTATEEEITAALKEIGIE